MNKTRNAERKMNTLLPMKIISDEDDDIIITESILDIFKNKTNHLKRNTRMSSESEIDPEDDFHPELFGLLDNPGVFRFDDLDYPLAATSL